jgi:hypothetical protein
VVNAAEDSAVMGLVNIIAAVSAQRDNDSTGTLTGKDGKFGVIGVTCDTVALDNTLWGINS